MEERFKVYVRGDRHRGDEVIEALENLGARNRQDYDGEDPSCLYYVAHNRVIGYTMHDSEFGQVLMDNYREIKLPTPWKDGDVLINDDSRMYAIFSHIDVESTFIASMQASEDGVVSYENGVRCNMEDYQLATDEEVNEFYELLHKHGKEWDDEKKILVDCKWKPKGGEKFFSILSDLSVGNTFNDGLEIDEALSRWYYHRQHGNKLNFEVVCRFSNEKQMLEKEYELIQKYLSNGLRNKITNREQNFNAELTQEELNKRIGDPHWCQGCFRRHVSPGYKYCYFCQKEMLR